MLAEADVRRGPKRVAFSRLHAGLHAGGRGQRCPASAGGRGLP